MIRDVEQLVPGMVVQRNVRGHDMVILTAGSVLTESHIRRLKRWGISRVTVVQPGKAGDNALVGEATEIRDEGYEKEKERINRLFAPYEKDEQMTLLKSSILHVLMEEYHGREA